MNKDIFSGKWEQFKGKVKEKWGKLTDDDLTRINGKRDQLAGKLRERYGWHEERAEEELKKFEKSCCGCCCNKDTCGHKHKMDDLYRDENRATRETFNENRGNRDSFQHRDNNEGEGKSKRRKIG